MPHDVVWSISVVPADPMLARSALRAGKVSHKPKVGDIVQAFGVNEPAGQHEVIGVVVLPDGGYLLTVDPITHVVDSMDPNDSSTVIGMIKAAGWTVRP